MAPDPLHPGRATWTPTPREGPRGCALRAQAKRQRHAAARHRNCLQSWRARKRRRRGRRQEACAACGSCKVALPLLRSPPAGDVVGCGGRPGRSHGAPHSEPAHELAQAATPRGQPQRADAVRHC
eukprot:359211-Chlamydomonas_euryale.AAC.4